MSVKKFFELMDYQPIYHRPRRLSSKFRDAIKAEIDEMLRANLIKPAVTCWTFTIVIALKPYGSPGLCIDYHSFKNTMKADRIAVSNMEDIIKDVPGSGVFTTINIFCGYWRISLVKESKEMTAFTCKFAKFSREVMLFGLMNVPATFQRLMGSLFADLPFVCVYIDGVDVFSKTL